MLCAAFQWENLQVKYIFMAWPFLCDGVGNLVTFYESVRQTACVAIAFHTLFTLLQRTNEQKKKMCYRFCIPINHKLNYKFPRSKLVGGWQKDVVTNITNNYAICLFVKFKFICNFTKIFTVHNNFFFWNSMN